MKLEKYMNFKGENGDLEAADAIWRPLVMYSSFQDQRCVSVISQVALKRSADTICHSTTTRLINIEY